MMALVQTPAMFAVPNCINKGFAPPFIVRVGVVSAVPTQIKATIAGYVLQKEQARTRAFSCRPRRPCPTTRAPLPRRLAARLCHKRVTCKAALTTNSGVRGGRRWGARGGGAAGRRAGALEPGAACGDGEPERRDRDADDHLPRAFAPQAAAALARQAHRRGRVCVQRCARAAGGDITASHDIQASARTEFDSVGTTLGIVVDKPGVEVMARACPRGVASRRARVVPRTEAA